ncbi:uncharacterized protein MYCFIDRAFT_173361 [Pseudocercospora fijiensis CIRAD86]|uniref:Uncharacterized protein n=1 Tax=Pseudocercospora fijiensis (strain CIRAD86) TaxID=383855 RepID=M3B4S7_PSEFD|nr:uncharacterized protein MYCFIDRAFT_173361 [Pseudocercospora fijiensis CIRAD86]EME84357.1 hypothetical protein MYCFIDRAFT_173361 [Pseudocercospora fijiensis CIRAD86]
MLLPSLGSIDIIILPKAWSHQYAEKQKFFRQPAIMVGTSRFPGSEIRKSSLKVLTRERSAGLTTEIAELTTACK